MFASENLNFLQCFKIVLIHEDVQELEEPACVEQILTHSSPGELALEELA